MSLSERSKRFSPADDSAAGVQPKIWVDGRQRPRFDVAAFGAVSLCSAKRSLAPHMQDCAARLALLADKIAQGEFRLNFEWAGRAKRFLPSARQVANAAQGLCHLMTIGSAALLPPAAAPETIAYPNLIRPSVPPDPGAADALDLPPFYRHAAPEEATLRSIRALMGDANPPPGIAASARGLTHGAKSASDDNKFGALLGHGAALGLAGLFLIFALPHGAMTALQYHLNGGDLKDWS